MTVTVRAGAHQHTLSSETRPRLRGYAKSKQAYDARRRAEVEPTVRAEMRDYTAVLKRDPCSYCMDFCGQMAADHIVALKDGGENAATNLTAAGRPCNASKKDKPLLLWMAGR